MTITVNGTKKELERPTITVLDILSSEGVASPEMVSVQVNGDIIRRELYESTSLEHEDEVEFLYFMGGGTYRCH